MKRVVFMTLLIGLSVIAFGQPTATEYFAKLPDIPGSPCNMTGKMRDEFRDKLTTVTDVMDQDIHARGEAQEKFVNDHRDDAIATSMKNAGLEGVDIQKMKQMDTKHMSKEEKDAMVDQLMQQNMNMSMEEVKKLKTYDTAAQRRWVQAYATERMADQSSDPAKLKADQLRNKTMFDLLQHQKNLTARMNAGWGKYRQMFDSLQVVADTALAELNRELKPLYDQIEKGNLSEDQYEQVMDQIQQQKMSYCQSYNPKYCKILFEYKEHQFDLLIKSEYDTLENVQNKILTAQLGVENPLYKPGLYALQAVQAYGRLLGTIFRYSLYTPDDVVVGQ